MAKVADIYFVTDPWKIIEEGFAPEYSAVAESVFSLGNEYMGVRGMMEEGYSGESLIGSYFNGIYERLPQKGSYKGVVDCTEYMLNSVNWLASGIMLDGEVLDVNTCKIRDFKRILNLKDGVLTRSFVWITQTGKELALTFERFLSMAQEKAGAQKITFTPLNFDGEAEVVLKLDFSIIHQAAGENLWECEMPQTKDNYFSMLGTTRTTRQQVFSCCKVFGDSPVSGEEYKEEKQIGRTYKVALSRGKASVIGRVIYNLVRKEIESSPSYEESIRVFAAEMDGAEQKVSELEYDRLKEESRLWWQKVWEKSDIVIEGDEQNQQGIRFCIFQMFQTYHGTKPGTNIGAKGLTGEAYNGNAFWDTETYCLPFYIFNDVKSARNLLMFRYLTLPEAKLRAADLDCEGAFYPIATISGKECCNLWQHASLQLQASTAVAYGIWFYMKQTGDYDFMYECGLEMLVEISRMLATRGAFTENGTKYGYYCVMGPDEFQMMVNHNFYTNYMGRFTLNYTLEAIEQLRQKDEDKVSAVLNKSGVEEEETKLWKKIADCMYLPQDEETGIFEQHDGYFKLPHVDVDAIPVEDFPLYNHWSYDRIYRNDMIKQPDVLMAMLLFNSEFTEKQLKDNYEYYEPRCIHESSLSPSVHSILAAQLKKQKEAYDFFGFATRMDLDNYNRNTNEGLHTTSIAAAWMNIIYGFGGMRSDSEVLRINPSIPDHWKSYSFCITYQGEVVSVTVEKEQITVYTKSGKEIMLQIYEDSVSISGKKTVIRIPDKWRT